MSKDIDEESQKVKDLKNAMELIDDEGNVLLHNDGLMTAHIIIDNKGDYVLQVKVPNRTTNEWVFGKNEQDAKARSAVIISSYLDGLDFVQDRVRAIFSKEKAKI